ncbi:hypothetical protein [Methanobacterium alcaliphilum]|uniref:hypothetical protein n=1 Tax=Methanobacterium alcaliphilum TaxID=392018 RepID=UPI00200B587B|nr:hypothetical protein [Methanobacterium alcaliphilum]MCK9150564.1 hypothetical protein [Methanobacterium alcaliphilum]
MQYWCDKESLYPAGPMKAAYGTFLTSLVMIKCHDMVADQVAAKFNVTWCRTSPIVVSVCDEVDSYYMTLECDHGFGMNVTGDPSNVMAFRFACSAAINPIEHWVMETLFPGSNGSSITIDLGNNILNGEAVDMFWSNGYLVLKSAENDKFLVMDPETGILRDVMLSEIEYFSGGYCFSDQQTEWCLDMINDLLSDETPIWMKIIVSSLITGSVFEAGTAALPEIAAACFEVPVVGWAIGAAIVDIYLLVEYPEIAVPANLKAIPIIGTVFTIYSTQSMLWGQGEPLTPERIQKSISDTTKFFISISEKEYAEIYNTFVPQDEHNKRNAQWYSEQIRKLKKLATALTAISGGDDGDYDEPGKVIEALVTDAGKRITRGISKYQAGDVAGGSVDIAIAITEIHMSFTIKIAFP